MQYIDLTDYDYDYFEGCFEKYFSMNCRDCLIGQFAMKINNETLSISAASAVSKLKLNNNGIYNNCYALAR